MNKRNKLRMALKGLVNPEHVDYNNLGYDTYSFGCYGKPTNEEVQSACIDIICELFEDVLKEEEKEVDEDDVTYYEG